MITKTLDRAALGGLWAAAISGGFLAALIVVSDTRKTMLLRDLNRLISCRFPSGEKTGFRPRKCPVEVPF